MGAMAAGVVCSVRASDPDVSLQTSDRTEPAANIRGRVDNQDAQIGMYRSENRLFFVNSTVKQILLFDE